MNFKFKLLAKTKYFFNKSGKDNISAIAAQSAFFLILSIVPFFMFAFAVLTFFNVPESLFNTYLKQAVTSDAGAYFKDFFDAAYKSSAGVAFTTIIAALWSAGKGLYSIAEGINRIYKIRDKKFWIVKRIYAMGYTFLMFLVIVLSGSLLILVEFFDEIIRPYVKSLPYSVELLYTLRYAVAFVLIVVLMSLALKLYLRTKLKDKRWAKFRLQLPGVILTALSFLVLSLGIRIYVRYFNGFSVYGSLTTLAVIMIWVYFSMYIMLYCVQFNYVNRREIYNFKLKNLFKCKSKPIDKLG